MSDLLLKKEKLGSTIRVLEEKVALFKSKLENMKYVRMLNNGYDMLDEILEVWEKPKNMKAIGFYYNYMKKR